jgi:uncharacterized delta-60 repeat protein
MAARWKTWWVGLALGGFANLACAQAPGAFDASWRPNGRIIVGASSVTNFQPDVISVIDGRVTVAGSCWGSTQSEGCAFRLDAAGNIDESYGDPFALNNVVRSGLAGLAPGPSSSPRIFLSAVDPTGRVLWLPQTADIPLRIGRLNANGTAASISPTTVDLLLGATGSQYASRIKAFGDHVYISGGVQPTNGTYDAALARLDGDLRLDPAFNGSGVRRVGFDGAQPTSDEMVDFTVLPDGRIYGAVKVRPPGFSATTLWVVCFNPDGSLDPGFGVGGRFQVQIAGVNTMQIASDPSGNVVLGGFYDAGGGDYDVYVARLTPQGVFDTSFGVGGVSRFGIDRIANADDLAFDVAVQPDGKPIVAGRSRDVDALPLFVARLTTGGVLDSAFASGGLLLASFGGVLGNDSIDEVRRLAFDPEGRLYLAGSNYNSTFAIERIGVARVVTGVVVEPPADPVFEDGFE